MQNATQNIGSVKIYSMSGGVFTLQQSMSVGEAQKKLLGNQEFTGTYAEEIKIFAAGNEDPLAENYQLQLDHEYYALPEKTKTPITTLLKKTIAIIHSNIDSTVTRIHSIIPKNKKEELNTEQPDATLSSETLETHLRQCASSTAIPCADVRIASLLVISLAYGRTICDYITPGGKWWFIEYLFLMIKNTSLLYKSSKESNNFNTAVEKSNQTSEKNIINFIKSNGSRLSKKEKIKAGFMLGIVSSLNSLAKNNLLLLETAKETLKLYYIPKSLPYSVLLTYSVLLETINLNNLQPQHINLNPLLLNNLALERRRELILEIYKAIMQADSRDKLTINNLPLMSLRGFPRIQNQQIITHRHKLTALALTSVLAQNEDLKNIQKTELIFYIKLFTFLWLRPYKERINIDDLKCFMDIILRDTEKPYPSLFEKGYIHGYTYQKGFRSSCEIVDRTITVHDEYKILKLCPELLEILTPSEPPEVFPNPDLDSALKKLKGDKPNEESTEEKLLKNKNKNKEEEEEKEEQFLFAALHFKRTCNWITAERKNPLEQKITLPHKRLEELLNASKIITYLEGTDKLDKYAKANVESIKTTLATLLIDRALTYHKIPLYEKKKDTLRALEGKPFLTEGEQQAIAETLGDIDTLLKNKKGMGFCYRAVKNCLGQPNPEKNSSTKRKSTLFAPQDQETAAPTPPSKKVKKL